MLNRFLAVLLHLARSEQFCQIYTIVRHAVTSVLWFWEAEFTNHNLGRNKAEWEVRNGKNVLLKEKVSETNWLSPSAELFPRRRSLIQTPRTAVKSVCVSESQR